VVHQLTNAFGLEGRVALVTGAAKGIGSAIAATLAQAGATVIVADVDIESARLQVEAITAAGYRALALPVDLAEESSIRDACAEAIATCGTPWVLVNNAGLQDRHLLSEASAEEWDRMLRINARGSFLMTREIARAMIEAGNGGRIVNIASAALRGSIVKGLVPYTASKGAMLGLSRASAFELVEHDITVNTVLPGGVATPGALAATGPVPDGPARRRPPLGMVEAGDIAAAVLFFASPAARRITNQELAVDGGFSVS
jgi:NAD(P)-dependent dehydrogenase (short-subunit alcohol dehydrogenase family)